MDKEIRKLAQEIKAQFNLGKSGITNTFIETIDKYLTAHKIVKIKTSIAANKDAVKYYANEIAKETRSNLVETKGFTFTLYRDE